jgi:hypothetical protein
MICPLVVLTVVVPINVISVGVFGIPFIPIVFHIGHAWRMTFFVVQVVTLLAISLFCHPAR